MFMAVVCTIAIVIWIIAIIRRDTMNKILDTLFLPQMLQCGFDLGCHSDSLNNYVSFVPQKEIGEGYYNVFVMEDMFSITSKHFVLYKDSEIIWEQPEYLHIDYKQIGNVQLQGSLHKGDVFNGTLPSMQHVSGIGISLMPEYYTNVLYKMQNVSESDLVAALLMLNTTPHFYAGKEIINQIKLAPVNRRAASMYFDSKIREMLALLIQWYDNQNIYTHSGSISDTDKEAIKALVDLISQTLTKPLSIQQCSQYTCMSKSKLSFVFRQITGKTISELYQYLRIEKSKELFGTTGKSIEQIANIVGYRTHAAFSAVFRTETGITPSEYKKKLLSSNEHEKLK